MFLVPTFLLCTVMTVTIFLYTLPEEQTLRKSFNNSMTTDYSTLLVPQVLNSKQKKQCPQAVNSPLGKPQLAQCTARLMTWETEENTVSLVYGTIASGPLEVRRDSKVQLCSIWKKSRDQTLTACAVSNKEALFTSVQNR